MKILFNAESLMPPHTGIGVYTKNLASAWRKATEVSELAGYYQFRAMAADALVKTGGQAHAARQRTFKTAAYGISAKVSWPYLAFRAFDAWRFKRASHHLPAEWLYFEPNFILKPFAGPKVAVVHDLSFLHYPEFHPKARVRFLQDGLPDTLSQADRVITPSRLIRDEIVRHFSIPSGKVVAIHLGSDKNFRRLAPDEGRRRLESLGLQHRRYVLSVATAEPRKNLPRLFDAYEALPLSLRRQFPLVIAGSTGWISGQSKRRAARLARRGHLIELGYVSDQALPAIYSGARVFAFPSIYEGFGLPVLEAMACGTAVVTSRDSAMAEFAGDSVCLCNPLDVMSIRDRLQEIIEDTERRVSLENLGCERARQLTWPRCAEGHLKVFREVLTEHAVSPT